MYKLPICLCQKELGEMFHPWFSGDLRLADDKIH